jgi:hypothetical protein
VGIALFIYFSTRWRVLESLGISGDFLGVDPFHHFAEFAAGDFDGVVFVGVVEFVEEGFAGFVFGHPLAGELAGLDFAEDLFHFGFGGGGDDAGAAGEVAVFGGVGDGIAHVVEAALVDQVDDELHFVDAFEVGHFGRVAGFGEGFEARFDKGGKAAAEDGLLAEEIGFAFILEGGFDDAGAGAADAVAPGESGFEGVSGGVLVDGNEAGDAAAFDELGADEVAGAFGGDEDDVDVGGEFDEFEVDVEAVGGAEGFALGEVGLDFGVVDFGLEFIGEGHDDEVGGFDGVRDGHGFEAVGDGEFSVGGIAAVGDDDFDAGLAEVLGVGVALGAVAEDGDGFAVEAVEAGFSFVEDFEG